MKTVEGIQWDSRDGIVVYREVYSDGVKGKLVDAGFDTNDPAFRKKAAVIAANRIGQRAD